MLDSVTLTANSGGYGGGVENSGALTLTNSLLDGNTVTGSGGGLWNLDGTALVQRTTVIGNIAYEGGGINTYGRSLELRDVNLVDNRANGSHGGGLYHVGGTAFISNATISGNQASDPAGNGGGIYQASDDNLTLTNATVVNNRAGSLGGGLYHYGRYAVLTNVTMGNNQAGAAGNAIYEELAADARTARRGADRQQRHLWQCCELRWWAFPIAGAQHQQGQLRSAQRPHRPR